MKTETKTKKLSAPTAMMLLVMMLTTTTVWAKDVNLVASPAEDVNLVVSPAEGGTIEFALDQDQNQDPNHLVVKPSSGFYIENVIHVYEKGGNTGFQTLTLDLSGNYNVDSTLGGTVTAYFKKADVRVSFNMNGHPNAANAPGSKDLAIDETVTRPTPVPTDGDYLVVGWYMDAACTTPYNFDTPLYNILNLIKNKAHYNLTVYALWAKENCTVTFKANGGTGTMDAVTQEGGTEFEIPSCDFSLADYLFIGWATSADGGVAYKPGEEITLTDDLMLYAKWKKENCTVTFKANGGTGSMDAVKQEVGTEFEIPSCSFSYGIYVCVGWATSADGGVAYKPGEKITLTDDQTLYARWAKENCTVTFKANGGTGTMDAVTKAGGTEFEIPSCGFSLNDYHPYVGWATSADGGVVYRPGDKITLYDDLTLYAKWSYPHTEFTLNGLKYESNNETSPTVSLIQNDGSQPMGDLVIPGSVTYGGTEYTVTTIGFYAFDCCTGLTSVTIPSSVTTIGVGAFLNCTGLTSVTIPSSVTTIEPDAFDCCTGLTSVTIPSSVETIGVGAFLNCTGLTSVTIPSSVTTIEPEAFRGCTGLTSLTIPSSVTTIEPDAFRGCTGLTSVTIPSSVTTIGNDAFYDCTGLTSVTIPEGVTTIGEYAFNGCTGLTSVTIPEGVTTIGEGAFKGCTGLTSVTILAPSLTKYGDLAFTNNATGRKIYVPSGSVDKYKAGWNGYVTASDIEPLHYIIDEGNDVSNLNMSDGTGKNVALKRSFAKGKKQTVCLPYAPEELLNYGKVWAFTGINGDKAVMTEITDKASLQANTPYIFEAANDQTNITFPSVEISIGSAPETAPSGAGFTFHGTYTEKTWEATSDEVTQGKIYGFMAQDNDGQTVGQFVKARRKTILRPFSCWLEYTGTGDLTDTNPTSQAAARRTTRGEGETLPDVIDIVWVSALGSTTGIHAADAVTTQHNDAWYSLDGRRLSGEPSVKGVYINNGRKVVIK